jgi:ribosomal protein S18 acetylase RimI-like enzyme
MPLVQLREMTASEFDDLRGSMIIEYAAEQIRDGLVGADDAYAAAKGHFDELLPGGLHTPEMRLLSGDLEDHRLIGYVWFSVRLDTSLTVDAWLYGIEVLPRQRGNGYGRALLTAVELTAAGLGATSLGLNVFASNAIARQLYASAGYELTAQQMRKLL